MSGVYLYTYFLYRSFEKWTFINKSANFLIAIVLCFMYAPRANTTSISIIIDIAVSD